MRLETPPIVKVVHDYDITFDSGQFLPITVDTEAGDTIDFGDHAVIIKLVQKPSLNDPDKLLPAEEITIFSKHITVVQHRTRKLTQLNPSQQAEWRKAFQEMTGEGTNH